jgi:hypothetical protein
VIDDELGGKSGLMREASPAERRNGVAHRRQIDHARHAGEVLQYDARRKKGDLGDGFGVRVPVRERQHVVALDAHAVLVAQQILEQDLERVRQTRDVDASVLGEARQAVVVQRTSPRSSASFTSKESRLVLSMLASSLVLYLPGNTSNTVGQRVLEQPR